MSVKGKAAGAATTKAKSFVKKAIKAKVAAIAVPVIAVVVVVALLLILVTGVSGNSTGGEAYVSNRAITSGAPDNLLTIYEEAGAQWHVPWELISATASVMSNYGQTVPADGVKRGLDPDTALIPEVLPPIALKVDGKTYEGPFLLDNSVAAGVNLQVVAQAADYVGQLLHKAILFVEPKWDEAITTTWVNDEANWKLAVDALPLMPQAAAAAPVTVGPPTCATGTQVRVVSDELAAAAITSAGTPPGLLLSSSSAWTVAQAVAQVSTIASTVVPPATLGKVYVSAGTYGLGLEADPAARTSDMLLDELVGYVGAANLVLIKPRDPGVAFYATGIDPVPEVWAAYDALVARTPGVTILDASDWPTAVGLINDVDGSAVIDPTAAPVAPTGFDPDGIHATIDASRLFGGWLNPQMCPPAPVPPPTAQVASARSSAIVALAKSWRTGEPSPFAACAGAGQNLGSPSTATSAYIDKITLNSVLATIRHIESGGDYLNSSHSVAQNGRNASGNPTGAYQYLYTTWGKYGGFDEAFLAPSSVQDARAAVDVDVVMKEFGDIQWIPVVWYVGLGGAKQIRSGTKTWDWLPNPMFNKVTVGQYQTLWMNSYRLASAGGALDGLSPTDLLGLSNGATGGNATAGVVFGGTSAFCPITVIAGNNLQGPDCDGLSGTGSTFMGVPNGSVTTSMLTYSPNSGYMQPAASQAWDQLVAAADAAGFAGQLKGTGFSPRPGTYSNHTMGLAIDVNALTWASMGDAVKIAGEPLPVYPSFDSPLYRFLRARAWQFGFCNPKFIRPLYLNGSATGGKDAAGNGSHLESWHWEFIPGGTVMNRPVAGDLNGPAGIPD